MKKNKSKKILQFFRKKIDTYKEFHEITTNHIFTIANKYDLEEVIPEGYYPKPLGYGLSSKVYAAKDENYILGLSFDINKMIYLKDLGRKDIIEFKILGIHEYEKNKYVFVYKMEKLITWEEYDYKNYKDFSSFCSEYGGYRKNISEIIHETLCEFDIVLIDDTFYSKKLNKKYLPKFTYDIHEDQILVHGEELLCLDPIISNNLK